MPIPPFEIDDDAWSEYVEEMENISLNPEEEQEEEEPPIVFEKNGAARIEDSEGNGFTISMDEYIETITNGGSPCPLCGKKGLVVLGVVEPQQFCLKCEKCDGRFRIVEGVICVFDD